MDDNDPDFEVLDFANLPEESTGGPGVIHISTFVGDLGPRVLYFETPGRKQPRFSVSIEETPRILVATLPERVVGQMSPFVMEWVRRNRAALLDFWNDAAWWPDKDVRALVGRLQKLDR
jgi:hypothetical protein